ncbi:hypothetical protein TCE0_033r08020 [Talaromyces pinophilus]|uniref:Fumarylacetoacetase-like C-terminal domain-containing protein n=1 Tax=Talaromyces pinophilus TaxID=128442 RepID=A0A6V8H9R8_TALPI|nr:hypothetical protein TCE0_033r08020 [Talaromyces pinophilus]
MFIKGSRAIADHRQNIEIPRVAQGRQPDYEGELVIVISRDCKNVKKDEAMDYVLGYTVGNDVSTRAWQLDEKYAGPMPQATFSKSFDTYAPLGPCIVSRKVLTDPQSLQIRTWVNQSLRQDASTRDMLFDVSTLISFLSQGTTLEAGSIIFTGTPGGVGAFQSPPQFLAHGDVVQIAIEKIGTLENKVVNV